MFGDVRVLTGSDVPDTLFVLSAAEIERPEMEELIYTLSPSSGCHSACWEISEVLLKTGVAL